MKEYELIVIGNGSGGTVLESAIQNGMKAAMVDEGQPGGTCMNFGCIPSKNLIFPADRIMEIQEAGKLGIDAEIKKIDFKMIMERMRKKREESRRIVKKGLEEAEDFDFYNGRASFVDEYVVEVDGERLKGDRIVIATGARPMIPPIEGLDSVDYMTSRDVLELRERPASVLIIGGGYIAAELGHFLSAVGVEVTIVEMLDRIVSSEEPEISALLAEEMRKRMSVDTGVRVVRVAEKKEMVRVTAESAADGGEREYTAEKILVAVGRASNADLLKPENTGVETDDRGFIKVDKSLRTTRENIWALGDATGSHMFKHVANREASLAAHNIMSGENREMDYSSVPRAIFTWPEIASFGMKEEEAKKERRILIGRTRYSDVAMGGAMGVERGFAKVIVDRGSNRILGYHIIGPYASILVQEVVNAAAMGMDAQDIIRAIHIHPALPELTIRPFYHLMKPEDLP